MTQHGHVCLKCHQSWTVPLSTRQTVLLKYCSSTVHAESLILLVTPQKPLQLTLMAADEIKADTQETDVTNESGRYIKGLSEIMESCQKNTLASLL